MKSFLAPLFTILFLSFTSCDIVNEIIPDVETDYSKTFQIQIFTNSVESEAQIIDVTSSPEYNDFKNNIEGFELRKISYKVKNYNTPDDMYFTGSVSCTNEEATETYLIGSIALANLSELATAGLENDVTKATENIDKVLAWLVSPGRIMLKSSYILNNADGTTYAINEENAGSNFEIEIKVYLTVKTKV